MGYGKLNTVNNQKTQRIQLILVNISFEFSFRIKLFLNHETKRWKKFKRKQIFLEKLCQMHKLLAVRTRNIHK